MDIIVLTKREKEYINSIMNNASGNLTEDSDNKKFNKNKYDLNYRLKKKFRTMHEDYWTLVHFFKAFDKNFQLKSTEQTTDSVQTAKSQIESNETVLNTKCFFCRGSPASGKKMVEISMCTECQQNFGI